MFASFDHITQAYLLPLGLKIILALAIFIVGRWVAKALMRAIGRVMERSKMDVSLRKFLGDVTYAVLLIVVIMAALNTVGVETTAILAVLGAAGIAVGLALQGSLSNFAAGVMLIGLRPYKVADLVKIGDYVGRVDSIRVFHTILVTADFREITIPNGQIITKPIENLTILGRRRVDLVVTVAQAADLARVRELLVGCVRADEQIADAPATEISIAEVTDGSVKLLFRPWTRGDSYAKVATDTMERIKHAMEGAGLKYAVSLQAGPT
jgi:small conductance mechanosensitive channel